jgi:hypothetical protein
MRVRRQSLIVVIGLVILAALLVVNPPLAYAATVYGGQYGGSATGSGTGCTHTSSSNALGAPNSAYAQMDKATGIGNFCYLYVYFGATIQNATSWNIYGTSKNLADPWVAAYLIKSDDSWQAVRTNAVWDGNYGTTMSAVNVKGFVFEMGGHNNANWFKVDAVSVNGTAPTSTPTFTPSNTPTPTPAATDTPTPAPTSPPPAEAGLNLIVDGNMELSALAAQTYWLNEEPGSGFGRLNDNNLLTVLYHGLASCNDGFQAIGHQRWPFSGNARYGSISQSFGWLGGDMYLRFRARGTGADDVHLTVNLYRLDEFAFEPVGSIELTRGWATYSHVFANMPLGTYKIVFETPLSVAHQDDTVYIDDVRLSLGNYAPSYCAAAATSTPNPSATITRTPSPTPTNAPFALTNCDFEQGSTGWLFRNSSYVDNSGGPVGPRWASANGNNGAIVQSLSYWPGGVLYLQAWVQGHVRISVQQTLGMYYAVLFSNSITYPEWRFVQTYLFLPAGYYRLILNQPVIGALAAYDGITVSRNGFLVPGCSNSTTPTPTKSPTPSPTSTAGTGTVYPSATFPGLGTRTPTPSRTPGASATGPTGTPRPSSSPPPSSTHTDAEKTATAQGTAVATYTPQPSTTPGGGGGPGTGTCDTDPSSCPVGGQPEAGPGVDCTRPTYFWEVAAWIDYEVCRVQVWVLWAPENNAQVVEIQTLFEGYEPFGTLEEIGAARDAIVEVSDAYDWAQTGIVDGQNPDFTALFPDDVPTGLLSSGVIELRPGIGPNTGEWVTTCSLHMVNVFGQLVSQGACASINWLRAEGILGWVQFFFDVVVWLAFLRYAWYILITVIPQTL